MATPAPIPTRTDELFSALGLGVFAETPEGLFVRAGTLPAWLDITENSRGLIDLADHFPLLEMFLADRHAAESDIWTESDGAGGELYLQAVAVRVGGRRWIAIRSLPQALFTYQQLAHDFELEKEKVERIGRQLERATQAKSDFLAAMSHEIRTPLNSIIGMADVLSATPLSAEQRRCVEVFQRNGVGLLNLINDILDLSKVEAGHIELERTDFSLAEVIARALEVVEIRAEGKGLSLAHEIASGVPPFLAGDPNRLRQIVINLLGNSIKFTEKGGLDIRVEQDPEDPRLGSLRVAIRDTGIGIPADKLDAIFESFTQADSSTTRRYGGTGLGLTISKQLVELMGGRIWVESTLGAGSTFFFTAKFDVARAPVTVERPRASREELEKLTGGLRILLADDSEDNRFLIRSYLKRTNAEIEIAENGAIALEMFRQGHYDLVLMDVEMPVMDGLEATRAIRQFEAEQGREATPVLALTAHAFADMAAKGLAAGFTAILTKPIKHLTLLEALITHRERATPMDNAPAREIVQPEVVQMEAGMEDVVPEYLAKRRAEIIVYREALELRDFDTIRRLAHKMKGTGAGYGFPLLTELGAAIEKAAVENDVESAAANVEKFAAYVERVELVSLQ